MGFLVWFRKFYKDTTCDTYVQIANNYKQCNYGTARAYLLELEKAGYVKIKDKGKRAQRFIVDEEKYQQAVQ